MPMCWKCGIVGLMAGVCAMLSSYGAGEQVAVSLDQHGALVFKRLDVTLVEEN